MKKIYFLLLTLLISSLSYGQLVINELDANTPGTDTAEFIELKWTPNTSLNGYIVVLFNGNGDVSYGTIDLVGKTTDANGFFILANTALATGSDIDLGASNVIQNGPDAVAIYQADAASFPDGTAPTTTNLIDALVYGTGAADTGLLTGLGETVQYDENANGATDTQSIQRKTDGTYETKAPTFRASNDTAVCVLSLTSTTSTCDAFTPGTDTYSVAINFTGGGTSTYTVSSTSGTVGGDDPSSMATGTITVTGVSEGTDITVNVTDGGLCNLDSMVTSPTCEATTPLPLYENFDYGASPGDLTTVSGGNWVVHSGTTGPVLYNTTSLSMSGYQSSGIGGSVTVNGSLAEDVNREFVAVTSGPVYFSALVNISAATTGNYFFHLKDAGTGFRGRVAAKDDGSGNILFGIATSTTTYVYGTTPFNLNTTYLVVASYNIDNGVSNLYVMTTPSSTEPSTPEATDTGATGTVISAVALRQAASIPTAIVDGIQVATSWESVLSTNEFNSANIFKVYPNPTSVGYVNISATNNESMAVTVFDVLGKQVLNQTVSNNRLNVSTLKSGIYIMKISQNNATVTKKLVIK